MMRPAGRQRGSVPPVAVFLVIATAVIQQIGAALAVTIWPVPGGFGIVLRRCWNRPVRCHPTPGAGIDEIALDCGVCLVLALASVSTFFTRSSRPSSRRSSRAALIDLRGTAPYIEYSVIG